MHAPAFIALGVGLLIGWMAQRSRFCTVGALRDLFMLKDPHLFYGILALVAAAIVTNVALGQFKLGFAGQPVAHTNALWNFLGMLLSGLAFTLAGGCPGRQLIMSGEGDNDAALFVIGLIVGAGVAHTFSFASSPKGPGPYAAVAFAAGMIFCLAVGFLNRGRVSA
jgi:YedE family putative selenium metabolism protein